MTLSADRQYVKCFSGAEGDKRYGFNGKENNNEVSVGGGSYDFGARMYDGRLGRWWSVDPEYKKYPCLSVYVSFADNPIYYIDPGGETLRVAGMTEQAMEDLRSILPMSHKSALFISDEGTVEFDFTKIVYEDNQGPDLGVELMYRLMLSDENYEYNVSENVETATADNKTGSRRKPTVEHNTKTAKSLIKFDGSDRNTSRHFNNQLVNASKQIKNRRIGSNLDLYDIPMDDSTDGQVTIAPDTDRIYNESGKNHALQLYFMNFGKIIIEHQKSRMVHQHMNKQYRRKRVCRKTTQGAM